MCASSLALAIANSGSSTPLPGYANSYIQLVVADFNQDGKPDLAAFGGTGVLLMGNGDGTFTTGVTLASTSYPAVAADFNGDGKPDLAASYLSNNTFTIAVYLGDGKGAFGAPKVIGGSVADCLAAGDMNRDGRTDLVTCEEVYPGNGDGTFASPIPFTLPSQAAAITLGDLNQDGKLDLVAIKAYANGLPASLGVTYSDSLPWSSVPVDKERVCLGLQRIELRVALENEGDSAVVITENELGRITTVSGVYSVRTQRPIISSWMS